MTLINPEFGRNQRISLRLPSAAAAASPDGSPPKSVSSVAAVASDAFPGGRASIVSPGRASHSRSSSLTGTNSFYDSPRFYDTPRRLDYRPPSNSDIEPGRSILNYLRADSPRVKLVRCIANLADKANDESPDLNAEIKRSCAVLTDLCGSIAERATGRPNSYELVQTVASELKSQLEGWNGSVNDLRFHLQKALSSLQIFNDKEDFQKQLRDCSTLVFETEDVKLLAEHEFALILEDPSYQLPLKPLSEPARSNYEKFLEELALLCLQHPDGKREPIQAECTSGICKITIKDKPLFIFKPCEEEVQRKERDLPKRFARELGPQRDFLCNRDNMKCAFVTLEDQTGFLSEFYPHVIGSVDTFHHYLPEVVLSQLNREIDRLQSSAYASAELQQLIEEKNEVEKKIANATTSFLIDPAIPSGTDLAIWNHPSLTVYDIQADIFKIVWYVDYDPNAGNSLVQVKDNGELKRLISIDRDHALPSLPYAIERTNRIGNPGWKNSEAAKIAVLANLKAEYLEKDPFADLADIRAMIPTMTDEGLKLIVLSRLFIKAALQDPQCTPYEILQAHLQNKIYHSIGKGLKLEFGTDFTLLNPQDDLDCYKRNCMKFLRSLRHAPIAV